MMPSSSKGAMLLQFSLLGAISTVSLILSLGGNVLLNFQKKLGYVVWTVGDLSWIAVNLLSERVNVQQIIMYVVYIALNVCGFVQWSRKRKENFMRDESYHGVELTAEQDARNDEIYDAVFGLCSILAEDEDLEWDMSFIGEIADRAASVMTEHGFKVRFPSIAYDTDCNGVVTGEHVEEYY